MGKTLSVTVIDDTIDELTQVFYVDLYSPAGAYLADSQGEGLIPDNDTDELVAKRRQVIAWDFQSQVGIV